MTKIYKSANGEARIQQRYDEQLDQLPVATEHFRVPTRAGETFVLASGPAGAPPVVLLHGSGANASTWAGDIATWATLFRVYAVDLLGEPGRSAPVRLPLESDATASWLDEVLDALGVDSVALVGMSLGGWTALDYAIRRPSRVTRMTLLCPGGIGRQTWRWLPKALLLGALGRGGRRKTAQMVTGIGGAGTDGILDDVTLVFSNFNPRTGKLPIFSDAALQSISIPVQLILGDRDVMMDSAESADRVTRCIPDASVTVLAGTGHAVLGQTQAVMKFLRSR